MRVRAVREGWRGCGGGEVVSIQSIKRTRSTGGGLIEREAEGWILSTWCYKHFTGRQTRSYSSCPQWRLKCQIKYRNNCLRLQPSHPNPSKKSNYLMKIENILAIRQSVLRVFRAVTHSGKQSRLLSRFRFSEIWGLVFRHQKSNEGL